MAKKNTEGLGSSGGKMADIPDADALFDPPAYGQTAYWIGRWSNTRGETGPISETVAATVVA